MHKKRLLPNDSTNYLLKQSKINRKQLTVKAAINFLNKNGLRTSKP